MTRYVIEYHLLPSGDRQHPITRVAVVEAYDVDQAARDFCDDIAPGPDCVKVTITEVTEDKK